MKIKMLFVLFIQGLISLNCIAQVADFEVEMKSKSNSKLELKIKNNTSEYASIFNGIHRIDERSYLAKTEHSHPLQSVQCTHFLG
ncbi:hypothetical protein D0T60_17860 [Bacteroides sp. 224]|nr:hypothetical protein [Bacteroides sp. 224]